MTASLQRALMSKQVEEFYHDAFVKTQVCDFIDLASMAQLSVTNVTDIGGGCGFFAEALYQKAGIHARVVDMDPVSIEICHKRGVTAELGNALTPNQRGDEDVIAFNLILHHLVAATEAETRELQKRALLVWQNRANAIFVNEYIYDSYIGNASGWLIYRITSSQLMSRFAEVVAKFIPSLRANTFRTGVRFRAHNEWMDLFDELGFFVVAYRRGSEEHVSVARRLLLIKSCRRDSYLLISK